MDNGDKTAELRLYKDEELIQVVALENIKEVRDVASKTHAHAFEIVDSNNKAIIILSGETALESKDWIWAIRKIFWPVQDAGILGICNWFASVTPLRLRVGLFDFHYGEVLVKF